MPSRIRSMVWLISTMSLLGLFAYLFLLLLPGMVFFYFTDISSIGFICFSLGLSLSLFCGPLFLLFCLRIFYFFLPTIPNGKFKFPEEKGAVIWAIVSWPSTTYLRLFQPLLFMNEYLRFLILKTFGADVKFSSWLTGKTTIGNPSKIHVGENTLIGEHVFLATAFQSRLNQVVIGEIWIGNHTLIGAYSKLSSGVRIGDHVNISYNVTILPEGHIGDHTEIGLATLIQTGVRIGRNVKIGRHCIISPKSNIPDGTVIPDFTKM